MPGRGSAIERGIPFPATDILSVSLAARQPLHLNPSAALDWHKRASGGVKNIDGQIRAAATSAGSLGLARRRIWKGVLIMGMAAGGSRDGAVSEPNIVPLIDVLLVLIIIFMVIAPNVPAGLPTQVPQPSQTPSKPEPAETDTIVVQVTQGGNLMINQELSDWNTLGTRLSDIFKERADKVAFVEGADEVPFEEVARAIGIMRGAGIEHVGLITAKDSLLKSHS
jgi:biopolymer transport protein TolR